MRIVITGICGFVGSQLALSLRAYSDALEVVGLDNLIRPGTEFNRRLLKGRGIAVRHGDVRCPSDLENLGRADWVIDAAANPSVLAGIDGRTSSRQLLEHNLSGSINVLEYCRSHGAGMVLLSTSRVYSVEALSRLPVRVADEAFVLDDSAELPPGCSDQGIDETFSTAAPITLYGGTKLASEIMALEYSHSFGIPVVINRCGVLAGAGQFGTPDQGIFSYWVMSYAARRPLRYIGFEGGGHQVRDAFAPQDLADLLWRQMQAGGSATGIWSVGGGGGNAMSLAQLSRWCRQRFGPHEIARDPRPRRFDVPWLVMDARRTAARFEWKIQIPLPRILDGIAQHYHDHPDWLELSQSS